MKFALCQINTSVGNIKKNLEKILSYCSVANNKDCDLAIFPELTICGYPPQDLILDNNFIIQCRDSLEVIIKATINQKCGLLIGTPLKHAKKTYNGAVLIYDGKILHYTYKIDLPNYGVFDEKRLFTKGKNTSVIEFKNKKLGITICEDIWTLKTPSYLVRNGAEILIAINSSPFDVEKLKARSKIIKRVIKKLKVSVI